MPPSPYIAPLEAALSALNRAVFFERSPQTCLRLWSKFIRARDGHRCVDCHSTVQISAHHICRKSFLNEAALQTGNGITLCKTCHAEVHGGFNGVPNFSLPMDAQGGEKIETMERLYSILLQDAEERGTLRDDFYFLSDQVLDCFKKFQGFPPEYLFSGPRLRQAYWIWSASPVHTVTALVKAMFQN